MKMDGNAESHTGMKKELLVRRMATPNVTTKKNPDTQRTGYGPKAAKTDSDAKGRAR